MALRNYMTLMLASIATSVSTKETKVDLGWYPPKKSWINDINQVLNGTGTNGFVFNSSQLPAGVEYGTHNWCTLPHVRKEEYVKADQEYERVHVEVIHGHHKPTSYASKTFPQESYSWECKDEGLFFYGHPLNPKLDYTFTSTHWSVYTDPQGLDDLFQHGKDLYRLGQYEYSFLYRDAPQSLQAAVGSHGVFLAELAEHIRSAMAGREDLVYRHHVAHDGSVVRV